MSVHPRGGIPPQVLPLRTFSPILFLVLIKHPRTAQQNEMPTEGQLECVSLYNITDSDYYPPPKEHSALNDAHHANTILFFSKLEILHNMLHISAPHYLSLNLHSSHCEYSILYLSLYFTPFHTIIFCVNIVYIFYLLQ